jgi:hypothetical protein
MGPPHGRMWIHFSVWSGRNDWLHFVVMYVCHIEHSRIVPAFTSPSTRNLLTWRTNRMSICGYQRGCLSVSRLRVLSSSLVLRGCTILPMSIHNIICRNWNLFGMGIKNWTENLNRTQSDYGTGWRSFLRFHFFTLSFSCNQVAGLE